MAAILKLRRDSTIPILAISEPFFRVDGVNRSFHIGTDGLGGYITLLSLNTVNTGSINLVGNVTAVNGTFTNDVDITGNLFVGGTITLGNDGGDTIVVGAPFSGSLIPDTGSLYDLGTELKPWNHIYADFATIGNLVATAVEWDNVLNKPAVVSGSSQIDHNTTTNYNSSQHIDHSTLSISAGNGLSGGGHLMLSRTIALDTGSLHFTNGVSAQINTLGLVSGSSQIDVTQTTNYVADTGLEKIGNGYQFINRSNPLFPIGTGSIDLTNSTSGYTTGSYSLMGGGNVRITGNYSIGYGQDGIGLDTRTFFIGGNYSSGFGRSINIWSDYSHASGVGLTANSYAETIFGSYNTEVSGNNTTWVATDRLFVLGSGTSNVLRNNAIVVLKNGTITAPMLTPSLISTAGAQSLITYGFLNSLNVISGSIQVNADTITNFDQNVQDYINSQGIISGSGYLLNTTDTLDGDLTVTGITNTQGVTTDYIVFDTTPETTSTVQGTLSWNSDELTLDLVQNGTTLQLGQEQQYNVRNASGQLIPDGTPVMAVGTLGASGRILIDLMDGSSNLNAKYFLGITTEDIPHGVDGKVTTFGKIRGINTTQWNEGDLLYIDPTVLGGLTNVEPIMPNMSMPAGFVIVSHSNGTMYVRVNNLNKHEFAHAGHTHTESEITDLTHYTDQDTLNYINSQNVISGSSQLDGTTIDNLTITNGIIDVTTLVVDISKYSTATSPTINTTTQTVALVPTGSYDAVFFDYVIKQGLNVRAGTLITVHDGTNTNITDNTTTDLGDTSGLYMDTDIFNGNVRLRATTTTDGWVVKTIIRTI